MDKQSLLDKLRDVIGSICWRGFTWSLQMTEDEYWQLIYKQEQERRTVREGRE